MGALSPEVFRWRIAVLKDRTALVGIVVSERSGGDRGDVLSYGCDEVVGDRGQAMIVTGVVGDLGQDPVLVGRAKHGLAAGDNRSACELLHVLLLHTSRAYCLSQVSTGLADS